MPLKISFIKIGSRLIRPKALVHIQWALLLAENIPSYPLGVNARQELSTRSD